MKKFWFGAIFFSTGCISLSLLLINVSILTVKYGTSINGKSDPLTYLSQANLVPFFFLFTTITLIGIALWVYELIIDIKALK